MNTKTASQQRNTQRFILSWFEVVGDAAATAVVVVVVAASLFRVLLRISFFALRSSGKSQVFSFVYQCAIKMHNDLR